MSDCIGSDVSVELTPVCGVAADGSVMATGPARTDPDTLAAAIGGLAAHGMPVAILDARQAKAALSCRLNKTDANDAEGLAQLARTGWYRRVLGKRPATRRVRALLTVRKLAAILHRIWVDGTRFTWSAKAA